MDLRSRAKLFNQVLETSALAEGFALSGAVDIDLAQETHFEKHQKAFETWLANGHHGEMGYLERRKSARLAPRELFAPAQSIQCLALPYSAAPLGSVDPKQGPRYAGYLRGPEANGRDYHDVIKERLARVGARVEAEFPGIQWKACVDTSAVLEKAWAELCGLGWIGKNTLLIHPKLGSYFFIGVILWSEPTLKGPAPHPHLCGHCERCLTSCPTQAFEKPHVLNANRCISYWTLEKRGPLELTAKDRGATSNWVAGCDICQEACPFNLKQIRGAKIPVEAWPIDWPQTWQEHLAETEEQYKARIKGTALDRIKPPEFKRNLALSNYSPKQIE